MKRIAFKIRKKIIKTFLFCVLSVLIFAIFTFQVYREMGHRLSLLELADELYQDILEVRRFEKNFFLYKQPYSLTEAISYIDRVDELYRAHEPQILSLKKGSQDAAFRAAFSQYKQTISEVRVVSDGDSERVGRANLAPQEEALRNFGQTLVEIAEQWANEERVEINRLFQRALFLFAASMVVFTILGVLLAFYVGRLFVKPLDQMQQAMDKIAHGDFTKIEETESLAEEFTTMFRAFNRMIHELEEHQEQLVQSRKIAAIGTLTAGIAHELNNPINNIVLCAEALKEDLPELPQEEALSIINDILTQSERASEIVRELLDFSRSEQPEYESLNISPIVKYSLKLVRNQLLLSGIQEEIDVPDDLPVVYGERKSLQQVFLNLLINAVQAMPGGGSLTVRAGVSDQCFWPPPAHDTSHRWLKLDVIDSGVGIEPQDLPRIFDPFFTTKAVGKGTGLGLSVTYGIIQKHRGHIEVKSHKGEGTCFTVFLPLEDERAI
jgi:two-component system, NtrC family, sensor kinase